MNAFIAPAIISPPFKTIRLPRKTKKEVKKFIASEKGIGYRHLSLFRQYWVMWSYTKTEYKKFLIQELCKQ